jgi:hypothetical protein
MKIHTISLSLAHHEESNKQRNFAEEVTDDDDERRTRGGMKMKAGWMEGRMEDGGGGGGAGSGSGCGGGNRRFFLPAISRFPPYGLLLRRTTDWLKRL